MVAARTIAATKEFDADDVISQPAPTLRILVLMFEAIKVTDVEGRIGILSEGPFFTIIAISPTEQGSPTLSIGSEVVQNG